MNPLNNSSSILVPAYIREVKKSEKNNLDTMAVILLADIAFVIVAAIVSLPYPVVFIVAAALLVAIIFFGIRTRKYTKVLKQIDAQITERIEFYRTMHSL